MGHETSEIRFAELRSRGPAATGDLDVVPRAAPFDAVSLDSVFEHVPRPRDTLKRFRRATAPDVILFTSVRDSGPKRISAQERVRIVHDSVPMDINPWEHHSHLDGEQLDQLLYGQWFGPSNSAQIASPVNIGVLPERSVFAGIENALASLPRLARCVMRGDALPSVNCRCCQKAP